MRYRLMATYLGVPYHAGLGPDGTEATLFAPGPLPDDLGFSAAAGHWRKQVGITDLDALWQSRLVGEYRGEPCLVLDDLGDRLHIVYLGRDSVRARQLGYWEIDREVFEVVVARHDITGLTEARGEYPLASAMFPASDGAPGPRAHRDRVPQAVFAELLNLTAIPQTAYAVDEEVPGAMCLIKADGGFEVFGRTDDARLDVRFFEDEEAAYFYLFGVLAAEAVRSGRLVPGGPNGYFNGSRGAGVPSASTENVSKGLRRRKLPKPASRPAMVNYPARLTVPRS